MPLVKLDRAGNTGPIVFLLMAVGVLVGLLLVGFVDFCPDGFTRACVHVILGKLTGTSCECVPE